MRLLVGTAGQPGGSFLDYVTSRYYTARYQSQHYEVSLYYCYRVLNDGLQQTTQPSATHCFGRRRCQLAPTPVLNSDGSIGPAPHP